MLVPSPCSMRVSRLKIHSHPSRHGVPHDVVPAPHDVVPAPDVEVHLGVELVRAEDAHGDAAGDRSLERLSAAHAAGVLVDERAERDAQVDLVDARPVHVP